LKELLKEQSTYTSGKWKPWLKNDDDDLRNVKDVRSNSVTSELSKLKFNDFLQEEKSSIEPTITGTKDGRSAPCSVWK
jgi:hypothetical protein